MRLHKLMGVLSGLSVLAILGFVAAGGSNGTLADREYRTVVLPGSFRSYSSVDDLFSKSGMILLIRTQDKFENAKPNITKTPDGLMTRAFTSRKVKVLRVFKDDTKRLVVNQSIFITEPAALIAEGGILTKLIDEDYNELKGQSDYVVFLRSDDRGRFGIMARNLGNYNLNDTMSTLSNDSGSKKEIGRAHV